MYVCNYCGHLKEELELRRYHHANLLGGYIDERNDLCPECDGQMVEAYKCKICGNYFDNTELNGVCECCLEDESTVDNAISFGSNNTAPAEINSFFHYMLSDKKINEILEEWVKANCTDKDAAKFLNSEAYDFAEFLKSGEHLN